MKKKISQLDLAKDMFKAMGVKVKFIDIDEEQVVDTIEDITKEDVCYEKQKANESNNGTLYGADTINRSIRRSKRRVGKGI